MKTLFLIFHGRFPSEKAASIFAAKSCEAFAQQGIKTVLLVPRRLGRNKSNPFEFYRIKDNFKIVFIPTIDLFFIPWFSKSAFYLSFVVFSKLSFVYLLFKATKEDIIYSNEALPLLFSSPVFPNTLYELHDFPEKKLYLYKKLFDKVRWILVTNTWKMKKLKSTFELSSKKMIYEPNAVDIKEFDITATQEEARDKLNLPKDKKIVVYTGHLYSWKGVDTLVEAGKFLDEDTLIYVVGGTERDVERVKNLKSKAENIIIVGNRGREEIPYWQKAADVLVVPNTAKEDISKYYTSPMKLFEYMVSKRPIVASDIPSIAEILNDENSILVEPDNSKSFANGIKKVLEDSKLSHELSKKAFEDIQKHTWDKRAKRILDFINLI